MNIQKTIQSSICGQIEHYNNYYNQFNILKFMKFLCVSLKDPYFLRHVITKMKFDICCLLFMTNF